jgi:hypothetical protein
LRNYAWRQNLAQIVINVGVLRPERRALLLRPLFGPIAHLRGRLPLFLAAFAGLAFLGPALGARRPILLVFQLLTSVDNGLILMKVTEDAVQADLREGAAFLGPVVWLHSSLSFRLCQLLLQLIMAEGTHKLELIVLSIQLILNGSSIPGSPGYRRLNFSCTHNELKTGLTFHGLDLLSEVLNRLELFLSFAFQY